MTDHDDALPDRDRELDLGVLGDGVHPSTGQWTAITTTAAHRRRRRTWVLSSAAALVLIGITATVLLTRSDSDGITFSTGDVSSATYVIPPEGATDVNVQSNGASYLLWYSFDGDQWMVNSSSSADLSGSSEPTIAQVLGAFASAGIPSESLGSLPVVYIACASELSNATRPIAANAPDTTMASDQGPLLAVWGSPDRIVSMSSAGSNPYTGDGTPCDGSSPSAERLASAVEALRVVDRAGFEAWRDGTDGGPTPTEVRNEDIYEESPVTTTTSIPEDPPDDPADARAQIEIAVQRYADPFPDGTYPYMEDGVERAEEYRQRFATATEQAGSSSELGAANVQTLQSVVFTSPEEAQIQFSIEASLPSGRYTFGQSGTAVLQDGRWVLSRATLLNMLGRACTPPGGTTSACDGYNASGKTGG